MKYHLCVVRKPLVTRVVQWVITRLITGNVRMGPTAALADLVRGGSVRLP